jgi:signal transduction histidine kinase
MQIRHQLMLLLGIPVACQLLTVGWLVWSFTRVDELAAREIKAKRAIAIAIQIRGRLEKSVLSIVGKGLFGPGVDSDTRWERERLNKDFIELHKLADSDGKSGEDINLLQKDCSLFLDRWEELAGAYKVGDDKLYFAEFLNKSEFNESIMLILNRVNKRTDDLLHIYTPIAQEFHPKAVKARADLRSAIIVAIVANVLLVCALAVLLNKNTLSRLLVLLNNIKSFSQGQVGTRLEGNDELTDLDRAFFAMSEDRRKLEEIQKSMRAMVSHDLRSPLTSMGLRIEMMLLYKDESMSEQTLKDLHIINSEAQRLKRLAHTLLDIEKMEDGSLDVTLNPNYCKDICASSATAILSQMKKKVITLVENVHEDMICNCDSDRTIQVLVNLLSNATKFAPKNSTIEIKVQMVNSERVRFEVLDQGPGVPEEKQGKLFAKFSQLDQPDEVKKEGSGLGLYICKLLVEAQQGQIGYNTRPEGGSCFWFELSGQAE